MSPNVNIEWVNGSVQTDAYNEVNECPILAFNVNDEKIQEEIAKRGTEQRNDEMDFDSENSDDEDGVGEKVKTHTDRRHIIKDLVEFSLNPIPCRREMIDREVQFNLKMLNGFILNRNANVNKVFVFKK